MNLMDIRQSRQFTEDKAASHKRVQYGIFKKAKVVIDDEEE